MLRKIILRLSLLTLCFTPVTSYAGGWFEVDKIYPGITAWLLGLIKENPGKVIIIIGFFYLSRKFYYKMR